MRSRADLLLKLYVVACRRGAEIFGESYLPADRSVRILSIPTLAEKWYMEQDSNLPY
ncbi:acyl-homoserine-lactone acylase [Nitrosomonas communis]|uniref:Acyl-homoserine-lactone acylase n=1 Tax=Nitrosomonas communis TaxID=44574 RepID=A0A1I4PKC8_9PROT|nr:acyl-homoserine-lactone acylase [Nitrosomonas communis]